MIADVSVFDKLEGLDPKWVSFCVQWLPVAPWDVRCLWCFSSREDIPDGEPTDFLCFIFVPETHIPQGISNYPLVNEPISDSDTYHCWSEKPEEMDMALTFMGINGEVLNSTATRKDLPGTTWKEIHQWIYQLKPEPKKEPKNDADS